MQSSRWLGEDQTPGLGGLLCQRGEGASNCVRLACAHVVCQRVFTSSDMLNPRTCALIMEGAGVLRKSPALQALLKDQKVDLVLDVQHATSYYCVSHVERRVFWLEGIGHEEVDVPCTSNKCTQSTGSRTHCPFISSGPSDTSLTIFQVSRRNTGEPIRR